MKITITVDCTSDDEAHEVISLLTRRHKTWIEHKEDADARCAKPPSNLTVSKPKSLAELEAERPDDFRNPTPAIRKNVNPGEPAIGKIGTATQDTIVDMLEKGEKVPQPKYTEHLKLLWKRGIVKYDGEYYL